MKVADGKRFPVSLGVFAICFAVIAAIAILFGAKDSQSPFLFILIFGGLFVAIPAILGVAIIREHRQVRGNTHTVE